uniref:Major facilitator superfamily (MFS) profile domain-containing protein n=1 Tax=Oryza brachyantha TaxID=4533 RepID=J3N7H1_ORYBR
MGSSSGLVDWRGRPVDTKKHGGVRASIFIHMLVWLSNVANIGNMTNLVSYLNGRMNMGVAQASTTSTGFVAMMQVFTIPAAFLADSYLKRLYTILFFAPVQILGYIILAIQAHVPSLHPAPCPAGAGATPPPGICEPVHGGNLSLLMLGLYLICVGEGAVRACLPALGGDQRSVSSPTVPMSVFWLTPQFFLLGVVDVTSFVGLLEFFSSEASDGMKSIGSSIFYCMVGLAAWLNTMLIELVNRATRRAGAGGGWLDGADLNRSRLDRFYWLVCGVELVAFVAYLLFAWRYVYRNDQRVAADGGVHQHDDMKPASAGVDLGQF